MNRWSIRIMGLLMLLFFAWLFLNLQKQLAAMQKVNGGAQTTTTTTR